MPKPKNLGPCMLSSCENGAPFCKMTEYTIEKIRRKDLENKYNFIKKDDQLCYKHYLDIVEPDRNDKSRKKSTESLNIDYSRNLHTETKASSSQVINNDEIDWSKIRVNFTEKNVTMSREDFSLLVDNIPQMNNLLYVDQENTTIDVIDEVEDSNVDTINREANKGN